MKCIYCDYEDGEYDDKEKKFVNGQEGSFYYMSNGIKIERKDEFSYVRDKEYKSIIGCPKCNKIFMD